MAFTPKDRERLEQARRTVAEFEQAESRAIDDVAVELIRCGLVLADRVSSWHEIVRHADAIRDALEPFDSGVRLAEVAE